MDGGEVANGEMAQAEDDEFFAATELSSCHAGERSCAHLRRDSIRETEASR